MLSDAKLLKDTDGNHTQLIEQLYSHDAAVRVIRDLTKKMQFVKEELEEARKEAEEAVAGAAASTAASTDEQMVTENEEGITDAILDRISANAKVIQYIINILDTMLV